MRILSQMGTVDLPYESIGISRNVKEIVATPIADSNPQERHWPLAEYSTEAKARKAMEILQKAYSPLLIIKDLGDDIEADIKPNDWRISTPEPLRRDNFYFQFPSDDEVEA